MTVIKISISFISPNKSSITLNNEDLNSSMEVS